jgi:hypothetical protein
VFCLLSNQTAFPHNVSNVGNSYEASEPSSRSNRDVESPLTKLVREKSREQIENRPSSSGVSLVGQLSKESVNARSSNVQQR